MSEETLAQPLSGEEIIEAVAWRLREILQKQCHLNPALAYESFSADIHVVLRVKDLGREVPVEAKFRASSESQPDEDALLTEADEQMYDLPPNQVRMDTDQPIPVLTRDAEGKKEIKHIRFEKQKGR